MLDVFGDLLDGTASCYVVENLVGVPSYHYEPIFAKDVACAISSLKPDVIALELPTGLETELRWADECWPGPVVAVSQSAFFPFVPGDSIFQGYRSGHEGCIEIALVDAWVSEDLRKTTVKGRYPKELSLPGPELVRLGRTRFLQGVQATLDTDGGSSIGDLTREAHMARRLAELMAIHDRVLWIGGMAHWRNIVQRIRSGDFAAPGCERPPATEFRRLRLAPSALYRMTQRLPYLVGAYGREPSGYDETDQLRALALAALKIDEDAESHLVISLPGAEEIDDDPRLQSEPGSAIDVAKVLLFARNLALTGGVRERPIFGELLTAASATIGSLYAGRVYEIAMEERTSAASASLERLEHEVRDGRETYFCGDEVMDARPWLPPRTSEIPLSAKEVRRRARAESFKDLPARESRAKEIWECDPDDQERYLAFVSYLMRRASLSDPGDVKSIPFSTGMRDGLDVRATLLHWAEGKIYVREEQRGHLNFTNAAIDWTGAAEYSDILQGVKPGGWIDPSLTTLGSCSRQSDDSMTVLQQDPFMQRNCRDFSLLTLDLPTSSREGAERTFYKQVILPLLNLKDTERDNIYGWLEVMFAFCSGKPFAYYSRYVPSPRIRRIAWNADVELVHFPLMRIPERLLRRNRNFRFYSLTPAQWEELQRRRSIAAGTWSAGAG